MTGLLEVLRYANIALSVFVGIHLVVTHRSVAWTHGRPYVMFLRLGTGFVILTLAYGHINAILDGRPPTETTAFLFVGLVWVLIGTVWTIRAEHPRRP